MNHLESVFTEMGGEFLCPFSVFEEKVKKIKAFVFDWDGVFNNGIKSPESPSQYAEGDSMGTNLMRFSKWLTLGKTLPVTGIITGANNSVAKALADREHFNFLYMGYKHKIEAIEDLAKNHGLQLDEIAFFFDDVLDISAAQACGLRIMIRRNSSPLFLDYMRKRKHFDYYTATEGGQLAVREACELIMGVNGNFEETLDKRVEFKGEYANYISQRNSTTTQFFTP
ncbi:hypothetical protein [Flexithrix dorotheae]|uniref:hypothetical protein n=1 Tax=Flexithrix dorotheae TaxID=70993 RepID=UPI000377B289|nr:hypothetical protein [Flexithrix dorotheae]